METELFGHPLVAMSDIHSQTPELVVMLNDLLNLDRFVVLTCGDMAGDFVRGTDGNPTPEYQYINGLAKEFYFVQGNHDLPGKGGVEKKMKNKQGKLCNIQEVTVTDSLVGKIGGVNGIISDRAHAYKMPADKYHSFLDRSLQKKPAILMTHDTPAIPAFYENGERYIGNMDIFNIVDKHRPNIHFYGHCHHPVIHNEINGIHYINLDARVLIFVMPNQIDGLFKQELEELYSPNALKLNQYKDESDEDDGLFEKPLDEK
jgi:Icc-related predicted phosphoesterase